MTDEGYKAKSIRSAIRTIVAFIAHQSDRNDGHPTQLAYEDIDHFISGLATRGTLRYGDRRAIHRLRAELVKAGALSRPPATSDCRGDIEVLYEAELHRRGYAERSIASHRWFIQRFLRTVWDDHNGISHLTHDNVRDYLAGHFDRQSSATSKVMSSKLRIFLRFCRAARFTENDLALAIPTVRNLRLTTLPSFMSADQLEIVLKGCDRTTIAGRRDFEVLLLLSRLGLRANEAACLSLDDIDWRVGLLRVKGKVGRIATMPLPQDVGAAISVRGDKQGETQRQSG
ncbi:hypothetical protein WGT02_33405 (plasmid) [Rhizobium sp. T1470]|uniref:tyrosine-type recombinase/integrase n=1 Tax=unclassified Rhizobium TaxID=2613769 RepID=UPI001AAE6E32|nr:hypothetical protein [Rhizobium sp. T1473]MCA0806306.1 hypothetical protein [Rhizobium sp. T1473]